MSEAHAGRAGLRAGHLLRVNGYIETAIISMWSRSSRAGAMLGMVEASIRGEGPDERDEDLLSRLRDLLGEGIQYHESGDFPAAMARMRVAHDLTSLRIITISDG